MLHGHGDDGYRQDRTLKADFSTNVWYGGPPAGLKEYLFAGWEKVRNYPQVLAESLSVKIAAHYDLPEANVLVTNGSTESIYLIAQAFKNKRTAITIPAFAEYEDACRMFDHQLVFAEWSAIENGDISDTDLLFICNPNNPTGASIAHFEDIVERNNNVLFIVDEAFIEFTLSISSLVSLTGKYDNLIVLRSMTKAYAIPGLRLGYIIAQPGLIDLLRSCKLPWTVNVMAMEAGHFIFDQFSAVQLPLQQLLADKAAFVRGLAAAPLVLHESHTHFFLAETLIFNAAQLKRFLLDHYDLLIRDAGNFRGLTDRHFRIATLSPEKNALLINALSEWKHTSL